jgi:CP family cyanate transporter-like MFS transporter
VSVGRPWWRGRATVLVAVVLLALNLRTAVAALSPIVDLVAGDVPLSALGLGILGMLPPIAFALAGIGAPLLARRIGLEWAIAAACAAMVIGPLVRAIAPSYGVLVVGTAIALAGMGVCNILLPPAVKDYFPDRIGQVTALYATLMSISTALPPLIAAPVAAAVGWRVSLGLWAAAGLAALLPWLLVALRASRDARAAARADAALDATLPEGLRARELVRSRVAWAITIVFTVAAVQAYSAFAWLPRVLIDIAGVAPTEAGALLALFGIMGLPVALAIPVLAPRVNTGALVVVGVGLFVAGYAGLLLSPATLTVLWVLLIGIASLLFPLCLVLINLRTRSVRTSTSLSGFVQGFGYAGGALGPLAVGLVHELTGGWTAPLVLLGGVSLLALVGAVVLARPGTVEDDLARDRERRVAIAR